MADEKDKPVVAASPVPAPPAARKILQYVGPIPAPIIGNLPGLSVTATKKANLLTPDEIEYVQKTVEGASTWWKLV